jgi:hypothetical protein
LFINVNNIDRLAVGNLLTFLYGSDNTPYLVEIVHQILTASTDRRAKQAYLTEQLNAIRPDAGPDATTACVEILFQALDTFYAMKPEMSPTVMTHSEVREMVKLIYPGERTVYLTDVIYYILVLPTTQETKKELLKDQLAILQPNHSAEVIETQVRELFVAEAEFTFRVRT